MQVPGFCFDAWIQEMSPKRWKKPFSLGRLWNLTSFGSWNLLLSCRFSRSRFSACCGLRILNSFLGLIFLLKSTHILVVQGLILLHFPCFSKYVLMFDFTFAWVDFQLETRFFVSKSMKERWIDGGGGQNMWTCTFPSLVQLANNTWTLCSWILRQASLPRQPSLVGKQWMVQKLKQRMSWCCKIDSVIHQVGRSLTLTLYHSRKYLAVIQNEIELQRWTLMPCS